MKLAPTCFLFIFGIIACENSGSTSNRETEISKESTDKVEVEKSSTEIKQEVKTGLLQLNNGKKWIANPETSEGMLMMQVLIKGFFDTEEDSRNYAKFTGELQYQCNYIIKNCTMKGESHEQLHAVLHPILEEVKIAQNASSYEEADESIKKVNELIKEYFIHFEVEEAV